MDKKKMMSMFITDLSAGYGGKPVIQNFNLNASAGEIIAIIGKSGSGKTTLLKALSLFVEPNQGEMHINGEVYFRDGVLCKDKAEVRKKLMLVFQRFSLIPNLTGFDNLIMPLVEVNGLSKTEAREQVERASERLGISLEVLSRFPSTYSGGQAQRVALLRAILMQPDVLLLDEITANLDVEAIAEVIKMLKEICNKASERKMTIILVTHLLAFAFSTANRILYFRDGKVWDEFAPKDRASIERKPETLEFLASLDLF